MARGKAISVKIATPKVIYTPEQIAAFRNRLDADLKQEYAPILSLFNGEYLNEK